MRYVAAYILATMGNKENPGVSDIEKILSSVGIECDTASAKKVCSQLNNKSVDDIIKEGMGKLASMPSGGGAAPAAAAAAPAAKKEEKKEEKKKEESEEEDDDMGFGLFD